MDHEDRAVWIDDENDLEMLARLRLSPNEVFVVIAHERIGTASARDHFLDFIGVDSMTADVRFVPMVPSKLHRN